MTLRRCCRPRCVSPRFAKSAYCTSHYVLRGLLKFNLTPRLSGPSRIKSPTAIANWLALRSQYIAFFSARANGLLARTIAPVASPRLAIAIALSLHNTDRPHGCHLPLGHWLKLIEYIWAFDNRIHRHHILGKPFRAPHHHSRMTARLKRRGGGAP